MRITEIGVDPTLYDNKTPNLINIFGGYGRGIFDIPLKFCSLILIDPGLCKDVTLILCIVVKLCTGEETDKETFTANEILGFNNIIQYQLL